MIWRKSLAISFHQVDDMDTYSNQDVKHVSPRLHLLSVLMKTAWPVSSSAALESSHGLDSQHPEHLQKQQWEQFFSGIPFSLALCVLSSYAPLHRAWLPHQLPWAQRWTSSGDVMFKPGWCQQQRQLPASCSRADSKDISLWGLIRKPNTTKPIY